MLDQLDFQVPQVKPLTETQRILLRAADIIEERGLNRGSVGFHGEARCTAGAIGEAGLPFGFDAHCAAAGAFARATDMSGFKCLGAWSDAQDAATVVAALRSCARSLAE